MQASPAAPTERAPEVYLVTMGVGHEVYERFGHNAIWIRDTSRGIDLVYNYGTFAEPESVGQTLQFVWDFIRGRPQYWLSVADMASTLRAYGYFQRSVTLQQLDLDAAQRSELANLLAVNAEPGHRFYGYDYYGDNCSTRVRDMLDRVLNGALASMTRGRPAEGTLRFHTRRSLTNDPLLYTAIDISLGPRVDRPLDRWDEMFLPGKLADRVRELQVTGPSGELHPLVRVEMPVLTFLTYHVDAAPPRWQWRYAAIGVLLSALMMLACFATGALAALGRGVITAWWLVSGVGGLLLAFFWCCTLQQFTYTNHNLFFLSPLAFGMISWRFLRLGVVDLWRHRLAIFLAALAAIGLLTGLVSLLGSMDRQLLGLLAPPSLTAAIATIRRRQNLIQG